MKQIRNAQKIDIPQIKNLLSQVLEIHAQIRPDIFISGTTKYTTEELEKIINNKNSPIFVAIDDDKVLGYAFCKIINQPFSTNMKNFKTLFIDDLCVDQNSRGLKIGQKLFEYVKEFAKQNNCYDITLNVWEGNDSAKKFYQKMGMFVKETQMEFLVK